jgi:hypothetical protein
LAETTIARVFGRAARDEEFRRRALHNLGIALAEEGFVLTDVEMREVREEWEPLQSLSERVAYERITALARQYARRV